jgi:hypothetical protein
VHTEFACCEGVSAVDTENRRCVDCGGGGGGDGTVVDGGVGEESN